MVLRDREAAWMLANLVGLGWSTLKAVIDDEPGDSQRSKNDGYWRWSP